MQSVKSRGEFFFCEQEGYFGRFVLPFTYNILHGPVAPFKCMWLPVNPGDGSGRLWCPYLIFPMTRFLNQFTWPEGVGTHLNVLRHMQVNGLVDHALNFRDIDYRLQLHSAQQSSTEYFAKSCLDWTHHPFVKPAKPWCCWGWKPISRTEPWQRQQTQLSDPARCGITHSAQKRRQARRKSQVSRLSTISMSGSSSAARTALSIYLRSCSHHSWQRVVVRSRCHTWRTGVVKWPFPKMNAILTRRLGLKPTTGNRWSYYVPHETTISKDRMERGYLRQHGIHSLVQTLDMQTPQQCLSHWVFRRMFGCHWPLAVAQSPTNSNQPVLVQVRLKSVQSWRSWDNLFPLIKAPWALLRSKSTLVGQCAREFLSHAP